MSNAGLKPWQKALLGVIIDILRLRWRSDSLLTTSKYSVVSKRFVAHESTVSLAVISGHEYH